MEINCIYPYTVAYGGSHGAIDIAPGEGTNTIIAAQDGIIKKATKRKGRKMAWIIKIAPSAPVCAA